MSGSHKPCIPPPAVIVLDEPTVGLDPTQIRDIRTLIRELGDSSSVILSTHLLSEVESVCDRVEIMQHGKLIYGDTSARMQKYGCASGFIISLRNPPPLSELEGIAGISGVEQLSATQFRVLHAPDINPSAALLALAAQRSWQLEQLTPLQATLEEVFARITDEKNRIDMQDNQSSVRAELVEACTESADALSLCPSTSSGRTGEKQ